ncbi:hypothetical protein [Rhodoligotrophos defluvii]|uniref:hypothetical protein n=1 Tax=Rhodoligotrophos defluvii TaxID=2561934 RepID=UPI0010C98073|nr:hypothetical protein [Rhodoligotrophos defluvii]
MMRSEFDDLKRTLLDLEDRDLSNWDRNFVEDMFKRVEKWGVDTIVTGRQWEQLQRMREQYV